MRDAIGRFNGERDKFNFGVDAAGFEKSPGQCIEKCLEQFAIKQGRN